jgi:hypothetical protein
MTPFIRDSVCLLRLWFHRRNPITAFGIIRETVEKGAF